MDPQKNSPLQGSGSQDVNPAGGPADVTASSLGQEAASAEMSSTPVAGQRIEPQAPVRSGDAAPSVSNMAGASSQDADVAQDAPSSPASSVGMPANPLPVGPAKRRRKKGLLVGLIVAAVVLLLSGGAAAAYFGYYVPNKPENVLKQAFANSFDLQKSKTQHFSGDMTVGDETDGSSYTVTYSGQADSASGAFLFSGEADAFVAKVTVEARSADGTSLYFKLGGLDGLAELLAANNPGIASSYGAAIDTLNDQWIEVSEGLVSQSLGGSKGLKFSNSDMQKMAAAYEQNQFIVVKDTLPNEDIKGVASYHYRVAYDTAKFKAFLQALKNANLEFITITDEQLKQLDGFLDEDALSTPWDIWISKSDKMVRQLAAEATEAGMTLGFRFTVDSYNQPVTVEKPEDAMSILEVVSLFLGSAPATVESQLESLVEQPGAGISL